MAPSGAVKGADGTNGSGSVGPFSQCGGGLSLPVQGHQIEKLQVRFQLRGRSVNIFVRFQ